MGELFYKFRKVLGQGSCNLCQITHGPRREKPEWARFKSAFGARVSGLHRDEMPVEMYRFVTEARPDRAFPCVVTVLDDGDFEYLLGSEDMDVCASSVDRFAALVLDTLRKRNISLLATDGEVPTSSSDGAGDLDSDDLSRPAKRCRIMDSNKDEVDDSDAVVPL
eukprot:Plantae.Rhodophyta-Rhodochaete_pulchella.ctg54557.p2 GENE.Plantae.Rhodophyta-Rhodochaete_pulchella.ctg54557~~Plantae.Rhodophyta-Rhodochaete_pulchella.ctg54557.p2  ORF type:complete len:181 (-),score=29.20 Plantae.Rhodophyta-Rhodochaete_pulchella.ctg54557:101-595(-)